MDDFELLQAYVNRQAEDAFAALVDRHVHLVYSAALRQMREPDAAQEVTQAVFIILARKAASFRSGTILAGWLLRTTRYTAANARRREQRRQRLEREAMNQLQPAGSEGAWERVAPLLDEALCKLGEHDRDAIALRFFQQKSFKEIGQTAGLSENGARMRVARALERLRRFFVRRGITLSALTLGTVLSANAVHAAPPGLAASVTAAALADGAAATASAAALAAAVLKLLAWARIKTAASVGLPALLLVGTSVYVAAPLWKGTAFPNQVRNGAFEEGLQKWNGYVDTARSTARATFDTELVPGGHGRAVKISVTRAGYYDSVELQQRDFPVQADHLYTVSFRARSTVRQPLRLKVIKNDAPWTFYGVRVITEVTPEWQRYRLSGRAMTTAEDGKLVIQCGGAVGDIWIDDVEFRQRGK